MNYSKFHNIVILLLAPVWLMSQEALVLDGVSGFPLEGVALFNIDKTKAIVINQEGKSPLELFSEKETITVQFYGFETIEINFILIQKLDLTKYSEIILSIGLLQS